MDLISRVREEIYFHPFLRLLLLRFLGSVRRDYSLFVNVYIVFTNMSNTGDNSNTGDKEKESLFLWHSSSSTTVTVTATIVDHLHGSMASSSTTVATTVINHLHGWRAREPLPSPSHRPHRCRHRHYL
uniref:Uncharacterized protein n=1 Tax=Oryza sativa subsp. japonica TaxID=39947 RepID=Q6UU10_ORYSJ|nr:hypothetical protein OSJNBa0070J19.4 [Oryza sativa Japonica Group]